jgi:hypothetical protein
VVLLHVELGGGGEVGFVDFVEVLLMGFVVVVVMIVVVVVGIVEGVKVNIEVLVDLVDFVVEIV